MESLPPMPGQEWEPLTSRTQDSESQDGSADAALEDLGGDHAQADVCLGQPMFEEDSFQADLARLEKSLPEIPLPGPSQPVVCGVPGSPLSMLPPAASHAERGEQKIPVATPCRGSTSNPCLGSESQVAMNANVPHASGSHED